MDLTPFYNNMAIILTIGLGALIILAILVFWDEKRKREHELALAQLGEHTRRTEEQKANNVPTIREKETIVKEVVMIPCKYCGGLMPQTAIFCPNCGAKRSA